MNEGDVYCTKHKYPSVCQPRKRARDSLFPKWWCFNCRRYVLPDNGYHKVWWILKPYQKK